ncbi:MAG: hypothetical protein ACOX18_02690 [Bacillota bacterium]
MADKRIPWRSWEFAPEVVAGMIPDGLNEFMYPDYPDLPYPDAIDDITWYRDPLVNNDEPSPEAYWVPEDPESPWQLPYGPTYPPYG